MFVLKEFEFDAAHYLPEYNGKCERLHGHTYKLVVKVEGTPDKEGMVIDFIRLKNIVKEEVLSKLDHACFKAAFSRKYFCLGVATFTKNAAGAQL
jgi:6-pyruvoyltetrahydropterin/6-carboxytetrahydropterin synthase